MEKYPAALMQAHVALINGMGKEAMDKLNQDSEFRINSEQRRPDPMVTWNTMGRIYYDERAGKGKMAKSVMLNDEKVKTSDTQSPPVTECLYTGQPTRPTFNPLHIVFDNGSAIHICNNKELARNMSKHGEMQMGGVVGRKSISYSNACDILTHELGKAAYIPESIANIVLQSVADAHPVRHSFSEGIGSEIGVRHTISWTVERADHQLTSNPTRKTP